MKRQGTGSVFRRLFGLFLVVVVVIYLIIAALFVSYVAQERETEENTLTSRVVSSAQLMEEQIRSVVNVQLQLFSDPRVAQLSLGLYADAYERSQLVLELLEYIENTQRINSIIEDIILSFPLEGMEISAQDGFNRKDFSDPETYRVAQNNPNLLVLHDTHLELVLSYPLAMAEDQSYVPDFVIRVILAQEHMQTSISPFCSTEHAGAFWLYRYDGQEAPLYEPDQRDMEVYTSWSADWQAMEMPERYADTIQVDNVGHFVASCAIEDYNLILVTYQDSSTIAWALSGSLLSMTVVFLIMSVMILMLVLWANKSVSKPIQTIMDAFEAVRSGRLTVRIYHHSRDEFGYIYESFNHMVDRIEELINNVREQEALLQRAERIQLQSQINPHFLYNSFYNIKFMARNGDYEQIETFVTALAKYYRFLNKKTDAFIPLSEELEHTENYIGIQQIRFGETIRVEIQELPEEVSSFRVPKLILQPIVENAYNYGLQNVLEDGRLWLRCHMEGKLLHIDIEDNGGNMDEEKIEAINRQMNTFSGDALNHALTNIHRRLQLSYGHGCGIRLSVGEEKGLRVSLTFDTDIQL